MLIYVNNFWLEPAAGPADVIQQIAKWVGQRANSFVDGERLAVKSRLVVNALLE
jgi:hypothetical protein